ncbi:hypothetical protein [Mycoplana sp. MJR14]|uniref:hypothetical protein n=1 Tax=Mycoplana sp. MJR14 TaxID=3032583 RepID=UPI0023D97914|nr:hypothetical protein [Mycoplana sp. MJR14]MDF1633586.1 hypothetical protein [Mycoplana sp. MJR14]
MDQLRPERSINWHMGWPSANGPFPTRMVERAELSQQKPIKELEPDEIRLWDANPDLLLRFRKLLSKLDADDSELAESIEIFMNVKTRVPKVQTAGGNTKGTSI